MELRPKQTSSVIMLAALYTTQSEDTSFSEIVTECANSDIQRACNIWNRDERNKKIDKIIEEWGGRKIWKIKDFHTTLPMTLKTTIAPLPRRPPPSLTRDDNDTRY